MTMQRKAWAAILGIAVLGLTGCPMGVSDFEDELRLGFPSGQRASAGDDPPGTLPPGGSTPTTSPTDPGTPGVVTMPGTGGTFGESGTNPTEVALAATSSLRVDALFASSTRTRVSIANTSRGILAMAGLQTTFSNGNTELPSLSVTWPSTTTLLALAPRVTTTPDASGEAAFKQELRQRLRAQTASGARSYQLIRPLVEGPPSSVWISTPTGPQLRPITLFSTETVTFGGRTTRFALAVDNDDLAVMGSTLRSDLNRAIKQNVIPQLQALYGSVPGKSEAAEKGLYFRDDVTYFIFSSKLASNLLGYFNPGDFFAGENSNQIKALYLSARAAQDARGDDAKLHDLLGTISHELQHLIFAWNRTKAVGNRVYLEEAVAGADVWIDEGLAMLATAVAGFGLEPVSGEQPLIAGVQPYVGPSASMAGHVRDFLAAPSAYSLVPFFQFAKVNGETDAGNPYAAYGMAYLFAQYMVDQLGTGVVTDLVSSKKSGFTLGSNGIVSGQHDPLGIVNDALTRRNVKLGTLFANFATAVALDGSTALASSEASIRSRYDLRRINLRLSPVPGVTLAGPAVTTRLSVPPRPYGIQILNPGLLKDPSTLDLQGNSSVASRLILYR